ncbi:SPOCS domain-containing protein [Clostridium fungisolvens]|uniref:Tol-Pal system protein TolB n=1 Tax=Clostridium fungisolvens TaxID=1604897 RepID=A0A6V8SD58_9CLOT|nr:SPOCS domain-containing protein [Clostridium fungisolvens]GFP74492.1 Tol-Pal system protein TolB [Clostridium fungisolvens]
MQSQGSFMIEVGGLSNSYPLYSNTFKQFQIQEFLSIPAEKPDIEDIIKINAYAEVISTNIIKTPCSVSPEGQRLTGWNMIVKGKITQNIEYISNSPLHSIHSAEFTAFFSNYIILDECITPDTPIQVNCYIEDLYVNQIDNRRFFKNVMLLLDAVLLNHPPIRYLENSFSTSPNFDKIKYFSQFSIEDFIDVPCSRPNLEQIISVIVEPEIISIKFINTMKGCSIEGQHLSGKKAVLGIKFKQKLLYIADEADYSVHGLQNEFITSAYVVVPELIEGTSPDFLLSHSLLKPFVEIEDTITRKLDNRKIYESLVVQVGLDHIPTFELCYSEHKKCSEANLFIMYENGKWQTPVTFEKECIKPKWSPNGFDIAYIEKYEHAYSLMLTDIKCYKSKTLDSIGYYDKIFNFCWSGEGRNLIFSALNQHKVDIYKYDLILKKIQNLTNSNGLVSYIKPNCCLRTDNLAYIKSVQRLFDIFVINLKTGETFTITECGSVKYFNWNSTGEKIVYSTSNTTCNEVLYITDLQSHKTRLLLDKLNITNIRNLQYSPNDLFISFIGERSECEDLYIIRVDSGKLVNITKNEPLTKISDYQWNTTGNKLFYACNYLEYFNIFSITCDGTNKKQLTNTVSNYIELSYRPVIR